MLCDTIVTSDAFIASCSRRFDDVLAARAEQVSHVGGYVDMAECNHVTGPCFSYLLPALEFRLPQELRLCASQLFLSVLQHSPVFSQDVRNNPALLTEAKAATVDDGKSGKDDNKEKRRQKAAGACALTLAHQWVRNRTGQWPGSPLVLKELCSSRRQRNSPLPPEPGLCSGAGLHHRAQVQPVPFGRAD